MPTESRKPLIVISYAHADEPEHPAEGEVKWLSFVTGYLRPAIKHGAVELWLDRLMSGGAAWEREVEQKLRSCDIFVLLVSRYSMSSDYVVDKEIAIIRERQAKGEAVRFYPLVLTPTPKIALELVRDKNLRPRDGRPFSEFPLHEREGHMSEAADEIVAIAEEIASSARRVSREATPPAGERSTIAPVKPRPLLNLSTGESGPFFGTRSKMYSIQRTYFLKVENVDEERHVTDIKIAILTIKPQDEYEGPWELEAGFALAAGDHKFVPLVQYGEANSSGYSTSAYSRSDSFFVVMAKGGIDNQPTGPKDHPQTILVRATGIGTAPCDYACRVWVQDPDGRLRIADANTGAGIPDDSMKSLHPIKSADEPTVFEMLFHRSEPFSGSTTAAAWQLAMLGLSPLVVRANFMDHLIQVVLKGDDYLLFVDNNCVDKSKRISSPKADIPQLRGYFRGAEGKVYDVSAYVKNGKIKPGLKICVDGKWIGGDDF